MEIKKKGNKLVVTHELKKNQTYKISKTEKFESIYIYKKPQIMKGVSSLCADGMHVLFIDFDEVPRSLVELDWSVIQREFDLPTSYLITTGEREEDGEFFGNYHIICLKKFRAEQIREIIGRTNADVNFMTMPLRKKWRAWILRIGTKKKKDMPKMVKSLVGYGEGIISTAHKNFFATIHGPLETQGIPEDGLEDIRLQLYEGT